MYLYLGNHELVLSLTPHTGISESYGVLFFAISSSGYTTRSRAQTSSRHYSVIPRKDWLKALNTELDISLFGSYAF